MLMLWRIMDIQVYTVLALCKMKERKIALNVRSVQIQIYFTKQFLEFLGFFYIFEAVTSKLVLQI